MVSFNWICPYCGHATTITDPNYDRSHSIIGTNRSKLGETCLTWRAISCPNQECINLYLEVTLNRYGFPEGKDGGRHGAREEYFKWKLMPKSRAKPQPEYIPEEIRNNYSESCLILNDSPKAAAALSRRCLQGMVRDFWKLPNSKRGNLGAELNHISDEVDPGTWDGIQAIRSIGDIGAHMEKDVNLIIDIEPSEAELLVNLIETLFEDWYVDRHKREERNKSIKALADTKHDAKRAGKSQAQSGAGDATVNEGDTGAT